MKSILLAAILSSALAFAQGYPTKPIRIVVPFAPGGVADITTRALAPEMAKGLGQQVIVENKPGAGGVLASQYFARAEPDGHSILLITNGNATSVALYK